MSECKFKVGDIICKKKYPDSHCVVVEVTDKQYKYKDFVYSYYNTIPDVEYDYRKLTKLEKALK